MLPELEITDKLLPSHLPVFTIHLAINPNPI
jgi:hypothetical protein